ncbi:flagellar basal body-associated protein FliL [Sulfurospirillum sp. 1612]|uniref:flagellar basal body-associated protein FliL n=1 Tax=Sulfurospirillum sp. 1612 TaxID=3094835 RepID=UPI002F94E19E
MAKEKAVDQDTEVQKKSGGNLVLIIVIVLLLLLLIGGGLLTYFLLSGSDENTAANTQNTMQQSKQMRTNPKRSTNYMTVGPMYPMSAFVVNLLSENGSRFLKTTIDLEMDKSELSAELDKKKPLIRDIIIRVLSSKTFEEVSTMKGKDKLKDEIVNKINDVLADGHIKNIFFTDFVVQ